MGYASHTRNNMGVLGLIPFRGIKRVNWNGHELNLNCIEARVPQGFFVS